jgi:hypothetical protein
VLYVQLDANWPDHPKIIAAGIEGAGLHALALCLAKRLNTDGWIPLPLLHRQGATGELIDRLVVLSLLDARDGAVRPHGWHERNLSQRAIEAKREAKRRHAKAGNHKRWDHPGEVDDCAVCFPETAGQSQLRSPDDPGAIVEDRKPSLETESKSEAAASDATDCDVLPAPPAVTAEQRRQRIMEAATQVAEERAIGRNDIGPGWIAGAARGIAGDHHQALHAYLVKHPDATVLELIEEVIDATGRTPRATGGVTVDAAGLHLPGTGRVSYFRMEDNWGVPTIEESA